MRLEVSMEQEARPEPYRIIVGEADDAERIVNSLAEDYMPILWNVQVGHKGPLVTCVLVSNRIVRQAQMAQASEMFMARRR